MKKALQSLFFLVPFCVLGFLPVILQGMAFKGSDTPEFASYSHYLKTMFSDSDIMSLVIRQFVWPTVAAVIVGGLVAAIFLICFRKVKITGRKTVALCVSVFVVAVVAASAFRHFQLMHYGVLPVYSSWTMAANSELLKSALYSGSLTIILQIGIVVSFLGWIANCIVGVCKEKRIEAHQ